MLRAFRVVRIFRILEKAEVIKIIINTFVLAVPQLMNVGGLFILILYIYAIIGMNMFAFIKMQEDLNERANF